MTVLERLAQELPAIEAREEPAQRSRAVLAFLVQPARDLQFEPQMLAEDPSTCPNCGNPAASQSSPYCGDACREEAAFVRQFRRAMAERTVFDEERQAALGQVLWHLLGGGYPLRKTLVTEKTWQQLLKRDGGVCKVCGAPATTFDHVTTACNRPINLQCVCASCSKTKEFGDPEFLEAADAQLKRLAQRIASEQPLRCSDDPEKWNWRDYVNRRKAL
ncbi:MAG: hypothetical protein ACAH95_18405 [Fimbriimonas sp.]